MVLPSGKVFSLALRMFTKPIVVFAKTHFKTQSVHPQGIQRAVIAVGHFQHEVNARIHCLALNKKRSEVQVPVLTNDKAFDAGAEFAAESLVYGVLLAWGVYEITRTQAESKAKDEALRTLATTIEMHVKEQQELNRAIEEHLQKLAQEGS